MLSVGKIVRLAGVAVALTLGGCRTANDPVPIVTGAPVAVPLAWGGSVSVEVQAVKGWVSTGVVVEPGYSYLVSAAGQWGNGICGMTDADAVGVPPICVTTDPLKVGAPSFTLLGRIGRDGKLFVLGSKRTIQPEAAGELFVTANAAYPEFTRGALKVVVSFYDPASTAGEIPAHNDPI